MCGGTIVQKTPISAMWQSEHDVSLVSVIHREKEGIAGLVVDALIVLHAERKYAPAAESGPGSDMVKGMRFGLLLLSCRGEGL